MFSQTTDLTSTPAKQHPHWITICARIEKRFPDPERTELQKWAIDAVSAHLMGDRAREQHSLKAMGRLAADDVRAICKEYDIELEPAA